MDTAQFAAYVLNISEHDEIAITNHPMDGSAYDAAVALNNYFALVFLHKPIKVFGTTGDTIIVVHVDKIAEYYDTIMFGVDPRHVSEIKEIAGPKCND
uniref:Uncharacterized protein n=1 Tax=Pseudomonas phage HRDY3 TaxID=3236930 RepID=A0AB39CDZ6_9VIRU